MSKSSLMEALIEYIRDIYSPTEKVTFSKDGAETTFFRKGGKSLCYINKNNNNVFTVTVVIGASLNDIVQSANISKKAKKMFDEAKQFHDGKWVHFDCRIVQDVDDIKKLLNIKMPVKK